MHPTETRGVGSPIEADLGNRGGLQALLEALEKRPIVMCWLPFWPVKRRVQSASYFDSSPQGKGTTADPDV
jgi:hypothetical protein